MRKDPILREIRERLRLLIDNVKSDLDAESLSRLRCLEHWIQPVFEYELEECVFGSDERFGSFVYGWPWANEEHQWSVESGWFLCQLDLDEIRTVSGRDFGSGLLQFHIADIPKVHDATGLNMGDFMSQEFSVPFVGESKIIPRSVVKRSEPVPFPHMEETPFDALPEAMFDERGDDLPRLHEFSPSEEQEVGMDKFDFNAIVTKRLAENGLEGTPTEWGPARRICAWRETTDTAYQNLLDWSDDYVLDFVKGDYVDIMGTNGLFAWPHRFPKSWPSRARPFFCFDAWDYYDTVHAWEVLYEPAPKASEPQSNYIYHAFGYREVGRYAL